MKILIKAGSRVSALLICEELKARDVDSDVYVCKDNKGRKRFFIGINADEKIVNAERNKILWLLME